MRTVINPDTGKSWSIGVDSEVVSTSTGGKPRTRSFASAAEAQAKATAEIWAKLKAGFVYADAASVDAVVMLGHAGKGVSWLGAAAVCASEDDESFYAVSTIGGENLVRRIDPDGSLTEVASLGSGRLVRSMSWHAGQLYADVDGQVHRIDADSGQVAELTDVRFLLGGSLRLAGSLAVWHDGQDVVVTDLDSGARVWRRSVEAGQWEGHTPMLAMAVSSTHVAWSVDAEEIHVVELGSGEETVLRKPGPELTDQLWLTEDGYLFTTGPYSTAARYDLNKGHQDWRLSGALADRAGAGAGAGSSASAGSSARGADSSDDDNDYDDVDFHDGDVAEVAMDRDRTRLALLWHGGTELLVIDATSTAVLDRIDPDYVVRAGGVAFTATGLALSTDYGCLARYRLGQG